jgi:HlyD family secretion protein
MLLPAGGRAVVRATARGRVLSLPRRPGDSIRQGEALAVLRVEDADAAVPSPVAGRLVDLRVAPGQLVEAGVALASVEAAGRLEAVVYVAAADGKRVRPGMRVELLPSSVRAEDSGYLLGVVQAVSAYPATRDGMTATLGARELAERFAVRGAPYEVLVRLRRDPDRPDRPRWSSSRRPPPVDSGTLCTARIVTRAERPIDLVFAPPATTGATADR